MVREVTMNAEVIIQKLFDYSPAIRYVALYQDHRLVYKQRGENLEGASDHETDRYEELLVNPTLLTLAGQRGNIDCGGLDHIIIFYGNFNQLIRKIPKGHLSICLDQKADLNTLPRQIFDFIEREVPGLIVA